MKKIALILSGCGHRDGSEITEAVSLLICLSQAHAEVHCFAPDMMAPEKNHLTKEIEKGQERNTLKESARIARGKVQDIKYLSAKNFDGLVFSGGYGAASNLSNWAQKGASCEVRTDVTNVILEFYKQNKPIAAVCIAPVLLARTLGKQKIEITVGNDSEIMKEISKTGAQPVECPVDDYITDRAHKIITTPAYMYDEAKPHEVFKGISGLCAELVEMS